MREIVLDTETTGLEFTKGDKIIEIGCVELINHIPTGKTYQQYLNPLQNISEKAEEIHGITNDDLKQKPFFKKIVPKFLKFIKNDPLVIHNAEFDLGFINNELTKNNLETLNNPIIDTLLIARKKFPNSPVKLDALCRRFSIDLDIRKKHGALIDAKLLAEVYLELKGGQQPNFNFDKNKRKIFQGKEKKLEFKEKKWEERIYPLSEDEKKQHKKLLEKIKDPIWKLYI